MNVATTSHRGHLPTSFRGIGYTRNGNGLPFEVIEVPVPRPSPDQVLIHAAFSSINPFEYKLADLNFLGRTPPVIPGFDLAGTVVAVSENVTEFSVGDEVVAMANLNGDGGWAAGGSGGYALAHDFLTAKRPDAVSLASAASLPLCFISAYLGMQENVKSGDVVYIPGGGGGVGHLATQIARRVCGARTVISSASTPESRELALSCGADHVFDYKKDNVADGVANLTGGGGVDVVYDATYSEQSFVDTSKMVRAGGKWIVLGAGPGKTKPTAETHSPVAGIVAARQAELIHVSLLRYFSEPATLNDSARSLFRTALRCAMDWAANGTVVPHIGKVIEGSVEAINAELYSMKAGHAPAGKVVVQIDQSRTA